MAVLSGAVLSLKKGNMSEKLKDYRGKSRLIQQAGPDGAIVTVRYNVKHQTGFSPAVPLAAEDSMVFFVLPGRPHQGYQRFISMPANMVEELTKPLEEFTGIVRESE